MKLSKLTIKINFASFIKYVKPKEQYKILQKYFDFINTFKNKKYER